MLKAISLNGPYGDVHIFAVLNILVKKFFQKDTVVFLNFLVFKLISIVICFAWSIFTKSGLLQLKSF